MKLLKKAVNVFFAFFMTLLIIANFVVNIFSNTILSKSYMVSMLERNNYYEKIEIDLQNGFENYKYQSGLPDEVFENLYTTDIIKKDVNSIIDSIYDGSEVSNSSEDIKNKIVQNVNKYLQENNIVLSQIQQKNIDEFESLIVKVYEEKISISSDIIKQIVNIKIKAEEIINFIKICLIFVTIVVFIIIVLVNIKTFAEVVNTILISFLASGILLNLIIIVIHKNIDINNILLLTQSLSDFIQNVINDILSKFNHYGVGFIIVGVFGIIVNNYCKLKRKIRE